MFAYIKGILTQATACYATLEASGIGYKLLVPVNLQLPQLGSEILLHTAFIVREQSQALYGFLSSQERDLFETLLGVTGIGPKLALSLIGHLSLSDLQQALNQANIVLLSKVPGIGKKIAERLVVELRDKLPHLFPVSISIPLTDPQAQKINDAMSALINLGYHQNSAQKAIKKVLQESSEEIELAILLTQALKHI
jgi:holliday junction DNA helicase RuvA